MSSPQSHGPKGQYHHSLGRRRDGGYLCYCGKTRNTLRSLHRHIAREGRRKKG